jgi:hypothetical protein
VGSRDDDILAIRPSGQVADALDHVHEQKLANVVIGLRFEECAVPVVLAGHLSQDAVFFVAPLAQGIDVVVEMVARRHEDHVRWGISLTLRLTHPS